MASRNGRTVYDIVTNNYERTVQTIGSGSMGVTLPKSILEEHDIRKGDEIVIEPTPDGNLKIHLPERE